MLPVRMIPVLVEAPALEPVSLSEMKRYLRLDDDAEDDLVATMITAARLMLEASVGRLLISQTWRLTLDTWPMSGELRLPLAPFAELLAVRLRDALGVGQAVPLEHFSVDAVAEPGRISVASGVSLFGPRGVELDVRMGYGAAPEAVPMPLRLAVRALAAHWFENRGDAPAVREPALPEAVRLLIAPFRRARLA